MSQLGEGVMLGILFGNAETVEAHNGAIGKVIKAIDFSEDALLLHFKDGTGIKIFDDGQSCCEHRYMTTDDDLQSFVNTEFVDLELREAPDQEGEYGEPHEIQFLLVNTKKGTFTVETHNEHNGYYGGFLIVVREL